MEPSRASFWYEDAWVAPCRSRDVSEDDLDVVEPSRASFWYEDAWVAPCRSRDVSEDDLAFVEPPRCRTESDIVGWAKCYGLRPEA